MEKYQIIQLVLGDIATNCWIVVHGAGSSGAPRPCTVIDPADRADLIIAQMEKLNTYPEYILLTHGHFDHIAALPDLVAGAASRASPLNSAAYKKGAEGDATGKGGKAPVIRCEGYIPRPLGRLKRVCTPSQTTLREQHTPLLAAGLLIAIHRDDAAYLGEGACVVHRKSFIAAAGNADYVDALWKPMPAATRLLEEGGAVGPFTVLHLPGHSPGSAGFLLEDEKVLFSGDTLFQGDCGRVDLPGGSREKIEASLKRLLGMDPAIRVLPGHGPATTIGREQGTRFF